MAVGCLEALAYRIVNPSQRLKRDDQGRLVVDRAIDKL
jgi:hypothetical protein